MSIAHRALRLRRMVPRHSMRRPLAMAVLALLAPVAVALDCAAIEDAEARTCCDRSLPKTAMTQTLDAAMADDRGTVRELGAKLAWKRLADGRMATRVDVTDPPREAGTIVLVVHSPADDDDDAARAQAFVYNPSDRRDRLISVKALSGNLLGLDFSYEDFAYLYGVRSDLAFQRLPDEMVDDRPVLVLEALPTDPDASYDAGLQYTRIVTRFDRERCVVLDTRFYENDVKPRKELIADLEELDEQDGRWVPRRLTMHDRMGNTRTVVTLQKIEFDPALHDVFFDRSALKRGR